jgi:calcineurin-like phosphoesterase family protein
MISDTHWSHKNIIDYCNRPFLDTNDMDRVMLEKWNSVVKKDDLVYHLGDVAFVNDGDFKKLMAKLNGRKFLICGNHDRKRATWYMENGFEWASRYPIIYDNFIILSHEPVFLNTNSVFANVHGHIHQCDYDDHMGKHFNVSVEKLDYAPIRYDDIKKWLGDNYKTAKV